MHSILVAGVDGLVGPALAGSLQSMCTSSASSWSRTPSSDWMC